MIQGLYAAATGMMAVEDRQAVIANNIANAMTPGFKRQLAVQTGYYQTYFGSARSVGRFDAERAPGGGIKITETFTDFGDGVVTTTGNPLDIAFIGPGFMAVDTPDGERFTRNGRLATSQNGQLVTSDGHPVQSVDGGAIDVSGGSVSIDGQGIVRANGEVAGRIRVVEFEDPHQLVRAGYTLYLAPEAALGRSGPAENTVVAAESMEMSNVQLPVEMTNMMMALRNYAANQRVILAIDETMNRLIDQVGAPG